VARGKRGWGNIRRFPSGRYQARYLDPDTHRFTPAPQTFATKAAADRWLARKRSDLDAGTATDEKAGLKPLSDWWPGYWHSVQSRKPTTTGAYSRAWRLRIEPRFGSVPVRRIKSTHVDDWIADMSRDGVSPTKVIEAVGVLRRVVDRAVRDKAIAQNPCSQRSRSLPRRPNVERPVLSPAEVERLASAMTYARDRLLVRLLAYGGLRVGEALALRWSDTDLERGMLTIRESVEDSTGPIVVGPTKTYAIRAITLPRALVVELEEMRESARLFESAPTYKGLVFSDRKGSYLRYGNWLRDSWNPAVKRSGVRALPHDLRATCASLLIDAGASVKDVSVHMGHADIQTTLGLYARVRPGRSADIAARLDALIEETG
jgi:integrase